MRSDSIEEWAGHAVELSGNGFHCAEAVAWAALSALGHDPSEAAAHATAFGGGIGRGFQEACGALTGAAIAIGHVHGRREPSGDWDLPAELAHALRQGFVEAHGTTHCATLRERFGEQNQPAECRELVRACTALVLELLADASA